MFFSPCCLKSTGSGVLAFLRTAQRYSRRSNVGRARGAKTVTNKAEERSLRELVEQYAGPFVNRRTKDLLKPFLFTLGCGGVCFVGASVWQYERFRQQREFLLNNRYWSFESPTQKFGQARQELNSAWGKLSTGAKAVFYIIMTNVGVYLAWRVPALQRFMKRNFMCSFFGPKLCSPMIFSVFSHSNGLHLLINMYVLWSFAPQVLDKMLGLEQFTAFYITAGCVGSMAGLLNKALTRSPKSSVGASGAILALLTYTCVKLPNSELCIVFLPMISFSAETAVYLIVACDLAGLLFRWKLFDHAAHLGGSLFGILYALYGEKLWHKRNSVVEEYVKLFGTTST